MLWADSEIDLKDGKKVRLGEILRIAEILLPRRHDLALEVAQESALKISHYPKAIENLRAFVSTVVHREVKSILRQELKQKALREKLEGESPKILADAYRRAGQIFQRAALCQDLLDKIASKLSERQAAILRLIYEGATIADIADTLEVSRQTVYDEIKKIRNIVEELEPPDPPASPEGGSGGNGGSGGGITLPPVRAGPPLIASDNGARRVVAGQESMFEQKEDSDHEISRSSRRGSRGPRSICGGLRQDLSICQEAAYQSLLCPIRLGAAYHSSLNRSGSTDFPQGDGGQGMAKALPDELREALGTSGNSASGDPELLGEFKNLLLQLPAFREATGLRPQDPDEVESLAEVVARFLHGRSSE